MTTPALLSSDDFVPTDHPAVGASDAIFRALEAATHKLVGPSHARLLVIPIRNEAGAVEGGLWALTAFEWLHVQMLVVPTDLRRRGFGTRLMSAAEAEAMRRGCRGAQVDAYSFQATQFYCKLGYREFGVLEDQPPSHRRHYFYKHFAAHAAPNESLC